jgi:hypothetical protein
MKTRCLILAGVVCALAASMQAVLIHDYFEYGDTSGGDSLAGLTTLDTTGWAANMWSGSPNPLYIVTNDPVMFVSSSSEAVAYANTVLGGYLRGTNEAIGTITRDLANPLDGTVWVSLVVTCSWWNAPAAFNKNHMQVLINGNPNDSFGAMCSARLDNYRWFVFENGTIFSNDYKGSLGKIPVLLVAKLRTDYSGSDDELTLWMLPCFGTYPDGRAVTNLGPSSYVTSAAQDIWGDSITNIGITTLALTDDRNIAMDSLRISYGHTLDDYAVYEVLTGVAIPEPAAAALAVCALLVAARRTKLGS